MSRILTLERSTFVSVLALTASIVVLSSAGSPRAQELTDIEQIEAQAKGMAVEGATTGLVGGNAPSADEVAAARAGMGGATEAPAADAEGTLENGNEPAEAPQADDAGGIDPADKAKPAEGEAAEQTAETPKPAASDAPQAGEKAAGVQPQADKPAAPKTAGAKSEAADQAPDDYYSKRAKEMLKADNAAVDAAPHPLAAAHPDQLVVVCEAGCGRDKPAQIVYMAPKPRAETASESSMVPASTSGDASNITCTAGCYGKSQKIYGRTAGALTSSASAEGSSWITTVSSEQKAPAGATAKDQTVKTASKNGGSGDWMAKINLDRNKDGATAPIAATAPAAIEPPPAIEQAAAMKPDANGSASKPAKVTAEIPAAAEAKPSEAKPEAAPETAKSEPAATAEGASATDAAPAPANVAAAEAPAAVEAKAESQAADANVAATPSVPPATEAPAAAVSAETSAETPAAPAPAAPAVEDAAAPAAPAEKTVVASLDKPEAAATSAPVTEAAVAPEVAEGTAAPAAAATKPEADAAPAADAVTAAEATPAPQKVAALDGKPVNLEGKDAEVNAAMRKARAALPDFFRAMDNPAPGETNFSLKVAIPGNGTVEHFWLVDVKREGDKLIGKINNEPEFVRNVEMGQKYEFTEAVVTDWLFKRNGKMVGNETLRPLLKRMAKEEAAPYWAMYEKP